jgi:hypothetical protein
VLPLQQSLQLLVLVTADGCMVLMLLLMSVLWAALAAAAAVPCKHDLFNASQPFDILQQRCIHAFVVREARAFSLAHDSRQQQDLG